MDYEEKYKNALENLKSKMKDFKEIIISREDVEEIFPELAKSEDERIRKELIEFVKSRGGFKQEYIAWIEKQVEPTEINPTEFDTRLQALIGKFDSLPKEELIGSLSFWLNVVQNDGTYKEEKQGKQKVSYTTTVETGDGGINALITRDFEIPFGAYDSELQEVTYYIPKGFHAEIDDEKIVIKQGEKPVNDTDEEIVEAVKNTSVLDMVEPKFKVGDWIISNNGDCVGQIIDFSEDNFFWCEHTNGYFSGCFKKDYHLWTLKDAKRGDVLSSNSSVFLFQRENTAGKPTAYCGIVNGCFLQGQGACWTNEQCHPATKEQRDILFQKMKEAGYEWDDENKKLKKAEDEEYNGEDYGIDSLYHAQRILEKTLGEVEGYQSDDGILEHKCAITAVKKLYNKKPTVWNEEDEKHIDSLLKRLEGLCRNKFERTRFAINEDQDWLNQLIKN